MAPPILNFRNAAPHFFDPSQISDSSKKISYLSEKKASVPRKSQKISERPPQPKAPVTVLWPRPDPTLIPEPGRISRGFDPAAPSRVWQAEQILKSFRLWPPRDGEIFVIQIDQDSPPPARVRDSNWRQAREEIQRFLTSYSGQLVIFRGRQSTSGPILEEMNSNGPFASASHPSEIDPNGQASCTGGVCGMAWLRSGAYLYQGRAQQQVFNPVDNRKISVARDARRDGVIDAAQSLLSKDSFGIAIQIHAGLPGSPVSVGCQTLPPVDFEQFRRTIDAQSVEQFHYLLVRRPNNRTGAHIW